MWRWVFRALGFLVLVSIAPLLGVASASAGGSTDALVYVSSTSAGSVPSGPGSAGPTIAFGNEDVLVYDSVADTWAIAFDGSAAGVGSANVDGFSIVASGEVLISFAGPTAVPGISGTVDDSDVVTWDGASFALLVDGSDVGLTSGGEDIDAIAAAGPSSFVVSTLGSSSVPKTGGGTLAARDEDLIELTASSTGGVTAGNFALGFDGSDVGLGGEDISGAHTDADTGVVYAAVLGGYNVGFVGDGDDIVAFTGATGEATSGTFALFFNGDDHDFGREQIDAVYIEFQAGPPQGEADLSVTKTDDVDPVVAGDTISYTVTVSNAGPDAAINVVAAENLPAGVTFVSTSGCTQDPSGLPTCSLGDIGAGSTASYVIEVTVDQGTAGSITNAVTVTSDSVDPNSGDNSASEDTLVAGAPIAVDDGPATNSVPGNLFHIAVDATLNVANGGAQDLLNNDSLGDPAAVVASFGGGDLGGSVVDNAGGNTAGFGTGSLAVNDDGSFSFIPDTGFAGIFSFEYRLENSGGSSDATVSIYVGDRPAAGGADLVYLSMTSTGTIDSLTYSREDIIVYDTGSNTWDVAFDGSDVGLAGANIDAFTIVENDDVNEILFSLSAPTVIPGITPRVDDSDIVRFLGNAGVNTSGTLELFIDGSDVSLRSGGEDIDALSVLDGNYLLSVLGGFNVPAVGGGALVGGDEDLIEFDATGTGPVTSGAFSMAFDGSDVDLQQEDLTGAWVDADDGSVFATSLNGFNVPGLSGDSNDIFVFTPGTTGPDTSGTFSLFFDLDTTTLTSTSKSVDGIHIERRDAPAENRPPDAVDDSDFRVSEDVVLAIPVDGVLNNDTDPDTDPLTVTGFDATSVKGATVVVNPDGSFSYDPTNSATLQALGDETTTEDTFTYTIDDGNGGTDTATVTVTVEGRGDDPVANDDDYATDEDTVLNVAAPGVLDNDTDPEGSPLNVSASDTTSAQGATVTVNPDGSFSYDPTSAPALQALAAGVTIDDTFSYTASDPTASSDTATVTITVTGVNDAPVAVDDNGGETDEDTVLTVPAPGVLDNDTDPDGDSLVVDVVASDSTSAEGATITLNADGSFTYDPTAATALQDLEESQSVTDTFGYTVSDGNGGTDTATVSVFVFGRPDNQPPDAVDDDYSTGEDSVLSVSAQVGATAFGSSGTGPGQFRFPPGVAVDGGGNIVVADAGNDRVQVCTTAGVCTAFGSLGNGLGQFNAPNGVAVDGAGNVVVADTVNHRIQVCTTAGVCTAFGNNGSGPGEFSFPSGVAVDGGGNIVVADTNNHRVQVCTTAGVCTAFGSNGTGPGQFVGPRALAVDGAGNVVVADTGNHRVQVCSTSGVCTAFGSNGTGPGQFVGPRGVAVDGAGNIVVADTSNNRVQVCTAVGVCTAFGSFGSGLGEFSFPQGVAVDGFGNIVVADTFNHRVQVFSFVDGLLVNDTDPDNDPLTVTVLGTDTTSAEGATVSVNPDGSFTYDPTGAASIQALNDGDSVDDTFDYSISDGNGGTDTATVTVTVAGVTEAGPPVGVDDTGATDEDTVLNVVAPGVLDNDTDPNSDPLTVSGSDTTSAEGATVTVNADGSYEYDPTSATALQALNDDESVDDTFSYTVSDGNGGTDTATVTVTVAGATDNGPPVANPDSAATDEDTAFGVLASPVAGLLVNDSDPNGDPLTVSDSDVLSTQGAAVLVSADGGYTYNPVGSSALQALAAGATVDDTFTYEVSDGVLTDTATVTITVTGVNDGPVADDDTGSTGEDTVLTVAADGVLGNDSDVDTGDSLSVSASDGSSAQGASVTVNSDGSYEYDPTAAAALQALGAGVTVDDTFSYTVSDVSGATDTATVTITVTGVGDGPVAVDDSAATNEDTAFGVLASPVAGLLVNDSDPDGDPLTVTDFDALSAQGAAVFVGTDGGYTYNPTGAVALQALAAGVTVDDTFTYEVSDGVLTDTATVTITVTGVNDAPVAVDDTGSTDEDTVLTVAADGVLGNDSDIDVGDSLSVSASDGTSAEGATVTVNADGSYEYDPTGATALQDLDGGESVVDTFGYTVSDGNGGADTATVTITVAGVDDNQPPDAVDDGYATGEDTLLTVAAQAGATAFGSGGSGLGEFNSPSGVAVDGSGNIVVADTGNHRVQVCTAAGLCTAFGSNGSGLGEFSSPQGVAFDGSGNIVVTDTFNNRVQVCTAAGVCTAFGSNGSGLGQFKFPIGVAVDGSGNIVVADFSNHRVQVCTAAGVCTAFGSLGSGLGEFSSPQGLAVDGSGNIVVADFGNHRVQVCSAAGVCTAFGSSGSGLGEFSSPRGVAVDGSGNIVVADTVNNRVQVCTAVGVCTEFGSFGSGLGEFRAPRGVAVDGSGNIVVADTVNGRVQVFSFVDGLLVNDTDPDNDPLTVTVVGTDTLSAEGATVAVNSDGSFTYDPTGVASIQALNDGESVDDMFDYTISDGNGGTDTATVTVTVVGVTEAAPPVGVDDTGATDEDTALNVAAPGVLDNDTDPNNDPLTVSASDTTSAQGATVTVNVDGSYEYDPTSATAIQDLDDNESVDDTFSYTVSDGNGGTDTATVTITVAGVDDNQPPDAVDDDYSNDEDSVLNVSAQVGATAFGSSGSGLGEFNFASGVAVDGGGNIVVADSFNDRVQVCTAVGVCTAFGSSGSGSGRFSFPQGVAVDGAGNIVVADLGNNRVQVCTAVGVCTEFGSFGSGLGEFRGPRGVAVDGVGNIVVADTSNHRVQVCTAVGVCTAFGSSGSGLGEFSSPRGVAVDGAGNIVVADTSNNRVQVCTAVGVCTAFGSFGSGLGEFSFPQGVAVDGAGNIVVADSNNHRVQVCDAAGSCTAFGSNGSSLGQFSVPGGVAVDGGGNIVVVDTFNNRVQIGSFVDGLLVNDTDPDNDPLTVTVLGTDTTSAEGATVSVNSDGSFTYDPTNAAAIQALDDGDSVDDTFDYSISDGNGGTDTATVTVTVAGITEPGPPVGVDDTGSTDEDTAIAVIASPTQGLLANDTDPNGDPLMVSASDATSAEGATVTVSPDGGYTYNPIGAAALQGLALDQTVQDTFEYTVSDGNGGTDTATVTITVTGLNDDPVAVDDIDDADQDFLLTVAAPGVLDNDTDADGDPLMVSTSDTVSAEGAIVSVNPDGSFSYDPRAAPSLIALDRSTCIDDPFSYTVSDSNGGSDTATVTVNVCGVGDDPVANDDSDATDEDTAIAVIASPTQGLLANDTDPDGNPLTVSNFDALSTQGATVTVSPDGGYTYDPTGAPALQALDAGDTVDDTFTYEVNDGTARTDTATVTITVAGVDDNQPPDAVDDDYSTDEDTMLTVPAQAAGPTAFGSNGSGLGQFSVPTGVAVDGGGNIVVADFDNDRVQVCDPAGVCTAFGSSGSGLGQFNSPQDVVVDGAGNIVVADRDNHRVQVCTTGGVCTAFGSSGSGLGEFSFPTGVVVDGAGNIVVADSGNNRIQVCTTAGVCTAFGSSGSGLGEFESPRGVAVDGAGNIVVADTRNHRVQVCTPGGVCTAFGSVGAGLGQFNFLSDVAVDGAGNIVVTDPFNHRVQVCTPGGVCTAFGSEGLGLGEFKGPNGVAVDGSGNIVVADTNNHRVQIVSLVDGVLVNDTDPDNDPLTVTVVGTDTLSAEGATVSVNSDGSFNYDPTGAAAIQDLNDGESVDDTFDYTISDGNGGTDTATVTVTVAGVTEPGPPVGVDDTGATDEDTVLNVAAPGVLDNDTDPNNDPLTVSASDTTSAEGATVTVNADGSYEYDPTGATAIQDLDDNESVDDTFSYTVSDGNGGTDTATVTITVTGVDDNQPPDAVDDGYSTDEDSVLTVSAQAGSTAFGTSGNGLGEFSAPFGVAVDGAGNIVVADRGNHRVQVCTTAGVCTAFGSVPFGAGVGEFNTLEDVAVDGAGNIVVADTNNARVQVCTTGGVCTAFGSFGFGPPGEFSVPTGVAVDGAGNIVVADTGNRRIQVCTAGGVCTAFGSVGSALGEFSNPSDVAVDGAGNIVVADTTNNRVQVCTTAGVCTAFGSFGSGLGEFSLPSGVAVDGAGNIVVADTSNNRVQVCTTAGVCTAFGSAGAGSGEFSGPEGVAVDGAGNIVVADSGNNRVQIVSFVDGVLVNDTDPDNDPLAVTVLGTDTTSAEGATVSVNSDGSFTYDPTGAAAIQALDDGDSVDDTFDYSISDGNGGTDTATVTVTVAGVHDNQPPDAVADDYSTDEDTVLTSGQFAGATAFGSNGSGLAEFSGPRGVAVDGSGNIVVADTGNHRVQVCDTVGVCTAFGSSGAGLGQFNFLSDVAVDGGGNIVVADTNNNRVQVCTTGGVCTAFGSPGSSLGQFNSPFGVAVDGGGNIVVADTGNNRVQVCTTGGVCTAFGSQGSSLGQFDLPFGVAVDGAGNIVVADGDNNRVQVCTTVGVCTAFGSSGSGLGQFFGPSSVAVDGAGNIVVADTSNHRVQVCDTAGVCTAFGSNGSGLGQFTFPFDVAVDGAGNIVVPDANNHRVQIVSLVDGLLLNDTDPDNDLLTVTVLGTDTTSAEGATVSVNSDGTFTYDPTGSASLAALAAGATLDDTFSYTISDGNGGTDTATVTVTVTGTA